jgi:hypothetical protein
MLEPVKIASGRLVLQAEWADRKEERRLAVKTAKHGTYAVQLTKKGNSSAAAAHERAAARCEARAKALRSRRIERHRRLARQAQRRSDTDRARRHLLAADDLENSALPLHIIEASAVARGTPFE